MQHFKLLILMTFGFLSLFIKVFYISKCSIRMATKYSSLKNRYEMYLGNDSNIELVRVVAFQIQSSVLRFVK